MHWNALIKSYNPLAFYFPLSILSELKRGGNAMKCCLILIGIKELKVNLFRKL